MDSVKLRDELVTDMDQKFPRCFTAGQIIPSIKQDLEVQIQLRKQIFDAIVHMRNRYEDLSQMVYEGEEQMKKCMDKIIDQQDRMEKRSAISEFERIWKAQYYDRQ